MARSIEKISIALPAEMIEMMKSAIDRGAYASTSEIVREALRGWKYEQQLRELALVDLRAEIRKGSDSPIAGTVDNVADDIIAELGLDRNNSEN